MMNLHMESECFISEVEDMLSTQILRREEPCEGFLRADVRLSVRLKTSFQLGDMSTDE